MICPNCLGLVSTGYEAEHWVRHHTVQPVEPAKHRRAARLAADRSHRRPRD